MAPRSVPRDKAECPRAGEAAVPRSPVSGDRRALWGQLRRGKVPGVTPPARPRDTGTTRERPAHGRDLPGRRAASSPSPQLGMGQLLATCCTALGRSQVPAPRAAAPHPACLQGHRDPPGGDNEVPSVPSCWGLTGHSHSWGGGLAEGRAPCCAVGSPERPTPVSGGTQCPGSPCTRVPGGWKQGAASAGAGSSRAGAHGSRPHREVLGDGAELGSLGTCMGPLPAPLPRRLPSLAWHSTERGSDRAL